MSSRETLLRPIVAVGKKLSIETTVMMLTFRTPGLYSVVAAHSG